MIQVTNTRTGEKRTLEESRRASDAVREAHCQDHKQPDNYGYHGPMPVFNHGLWTCGEWTAPGTSRFAPPIPREEFS